ncbi:MAG: glutamine synthetase family protein [Dehalococcoidia bacterium]
MNNQDHKAIEYVLRQARDNDVKFIRLWFSDILGNLKGFAITEAELEDSLSRGMGFDASSIQGFARANFGESDLYAVPDPHTFAILPWRPRTNSVARMFCNLYTPDGDPFDGDPRMILTKNLERASNLGFTYYVAPEIEYFYFKDSKGVEPIDTGGYFDQDTMEISTELRRETVLMLEELGIPVESSHHEVASSQQEIALRHTDALTMADTVMTYRHLVKEIAMKHGYYATFMPKPITDQNGSGMHTHQSLFSGDSNVFFDENTEDHLSPTAKHFIAGLLTHAREITAVTNQWVNSYKRLVPNFEAPTEISWATVNKSHLIRVPEFVVGREQSRRIEYRAPDAACNPYLTFAVMLAAGLEGIDKKYELPNSYDENDLSANNRLPDSLWEALTVSENSPLLRKALGEATFKSFIENKKIEWENYRSQVSKYEIDRYLPML